MTHSHLHTSSEYVNTGVSIRPGNAPVYSMEGKASTRVTAEFLPDTLPCNYDLTLLLV